MAGTKAGGKKAAKTNKQNDPDFYKKIGHLGGINGHTGGFASMDKKKVQEAGRKGGMISRRGAAAKDENGNCVTKDGRAYSKKPGQVRKKKQLTETKKAGFIKRIFGGK